MAELFKFRCFQCQKMLGVSPRKAGRPVICPRCGTELIVPNTTDEDTASGPDESDGANQFEELGIDLGFSSPLDLRPTERPSKPSNRPRCV